MVTAGTGQDRADQPRHRRWSPTTVVGVDRAGRPARAAIEHRTMTPTTHQTNWTERCPECDARVRTTDGGAACQGCGLVVADQPVDRGPERRHGDHRPRTGAPLRPTHANRGLSTWMGAPTHDGKGNRIDGGKRRRLRRQRTRQRRAAADATKETLGPGLDEIERCCGRLGLGESVAEVASVVFRRALDEHLLYGWAYEAVAAATVYIAARNGGAVRTLEEVVDTSGRPQRRVGRAVRHLQRELDLAVEPPAVVEYVPTVADDLGLSERTRRLARRLLEDAVGENLHSGRDPTALAASALYTVTLAVEGTPPLCQTEVGDAVGVSPLTLRTHFRDLRPLCPDALDVAPEDIESPTVRSGRGSASEANAPDGRPEPDADRGGLVVHAD